MLVYVSATPTRRLSIDRRNKFVIIYGITSGTFSTWKTKNGKTQNSQVE